MRNTGNSQNLLSRKTKIAIIVSFTVVLILAAACGIFVYLRTRIPDEDKLKELLPDQIFEYTISSETYKGVSAGEYSDDEVYSSSLVDIDIVEDKKTDSKYKVYCEIDLTDDIMDRTIYVYLEFKKDIINGWQLRKFEEYEYPDISLKQVMNYEIAEEYLKLTYGYEAPILIEESCEYQGEDFSYEFDIDENHEYIDLNGTIYIGGALDHDTGYYDDDFDEPVNYTWHYYDVEAVNKSLKAEGMWVGEFSGQQLRLNISSVSDDEVTWECSTRLYKDGGDQVVVSNGSSYLYFDEDEYKFKFDLPTDAGYYNLTFSDDDAEICFYDEYAESFVINNELVLESPTEAAEAGTEFEFPDENSEMIYVYSWNNGLDYAIEVFKNKYPQYADLVEVVNLDVSGVSEDYSNAIANAIEENGDKVPSIVAYDSEMLDYFAGEDFVSLEDIGITSAMYSNAYNYTIELGTFNDELKALTNGAYPVCFVYRKDIAEEVLKTSDALEVGKYVSDFDKFMDTADKMKEAGYYMLSGPDDIYPVEDVLKSQNKYDDIYNDLKDGGYTTGTMMWDAKWMENFESNVFGYFSAPWFTTWMLDLYVENEEYGVTYAPESYYWGGTYYGVTRNCTNNELAALLLYTLCCDTDFMAEYSTDNLDYPNNREAVEIMIASGVTKLDVLGEQEPFAMYDKLAGEIHLEK